MLFLGGSNKLLNQLCWTLFELAILTNYGKNDNYLHSLNNEQYQIVEAIFWAIEIMDDITPH